MKSQNLLPALSNPRSFATPACRRGNFPVALLLLAVGLGAPGASAKDVSAKDVSAKYASAQDVSAKDASPIYIRVNQVGYEKGAPSRAYVMTSEPLQRTRFRIYRDDEVALVGHTGPLLGVWGEYDVYPIDFALSQEGDFTIEMDEKPGDRSPRFRISDKEDLYTQALTNALSYYQNSRDGIHFIPSALRNAPGHLNDASAETYLPAQYDSNDTLISDLTPLGERIDASGGWWDAGDYLKFVETHSYVVDLMLIGLRDFPRQMGQQAHGSDFTAEARFGLDWLAKMWDDRSRTLYYQVGLGNGNNTTILADHDIWRLPQVDDTYAGADPVYEYVRHRPVLRAAAGNSRISPNLAGRLAADFALGAQLYADSDPQFAQQCLLSAEHIFDLADASRNDLLTVSPYDYYPETEWRDDMELGATEIYLALDRHSAANEKLPHADAAFYLRAAAHWAHDYITGPNDATDTLNLYDVSGLAHYELYRAMTHARRGENAGIGGDNAESDGDKDDALQVSRRDLLQDLKKQLDGAVRQAKSDPFGFGFVWNNYDTATHGAGLAVMAKEYASLTGSAFYDRYSRQWMANILGANAWGSSFIVGDGSVFPRCMQHQVANLAGSLDGSEPRLDGALVEGPNSAGVTGLVSGMIPCPADGMDRFAAFNGNGSVFVDDVQSYDTVEPALDLTAPSFLMFAWRAAENAPGDFVDSTR